MVVGLRFANPTYLVADANGKVVWNVRYRAYGNNVVEKEVEWVENHLRFQGQYFDAETGLHYNRFRYYDPQSGQFVHQDPIGLVGGENLYQYVPNPVEWIDPYGLITVSTNTALTDVLARGVHVNVQTGESKPIHVGLRPDHQGGIKIVPADPTAKKIYKTSQWKEIESAVEKFIPANSEKLASVAEAAKIQYPHKGAEFAHLERNIKKRSLCK